MRTKIFFFFGLLFTTWNAVAQSSPPLKLGLALSGGGAKGIAHIPVLEELEKRKIPVYCVTGTSIGSIVGGLYAMGYTPRQIEHIFFNMDWDHVLSDDIDRTEWAMYMKPFRDRYSIKFNFDKDQLYLPSGLIDGHNINKMLNRYTMPYSGPISFDSLFHPFACVATELSQGKKKVFRSGYLSDAIRASMSIPSVFSPVSIHDTLYVDGGLVQNNPVQEAFDLGADIVLAVNIGAPLKTKEELKNFLDIMDQSLSFAMDKSSQIALKQATFVITPNIRRFGILDFSESQAILDSGRTAVSRSSFIFDSLQILTDTASFKPNPGVILPDTFHISGFEIDGGPLPEKELFYQLHMNDRQPLTWKKLGRLMDRIYGRGQFKHVRFKLDPAGPNTYLLHASLPLADKNLLAISHHFDNYNQMEWLLTLLFSPSPKRHISFIVDTKFGDSPEFHGGLIYFIPSVNATALTLTAGYGKQNLRFYEDRIPLASFKDERWNIKGSITHFIRNTALISISGGLERIIGAPVIGSPNFPRYSDTHAFTSARVKIDQLNHRYFPTNGYMLAADFRYDWKGIGNGYWEYGRFYWKLFWNYHKKNVFFHRIDVGTNFNAPANKPIYFYTGGIHSFLGYKTSEFLLHHFVLEEAGYRRQINSILHLQFSLQGIYPMENNWVWTREIKKADFALNLSTRLKLPVSQVTLTFTHSDYRKFLIWFEFGYALEFPL